MWRLFVAVFLLGLAAADAVAQTPRSQPALADSLVRIELTDGSVFVGVVVREDDREVVLRTGAGAEVSIPTVQIQRRAAFAGRISEGRIFPFDPNRTRLLFSPTARPLGRGQGYFSVYELVVPFVAVGLSDRVSLAGGTIIAPGAFGRVLYVAPKVTLVNGPRLAVAVGGIGFGVFVDDGVTAGLGYGLVTYGGPERALTVGAGFAVAEGEVASGAILTVGGETQVSGTVKLLTENYVIPLETATECPFEGPCSDETQTEYTAILSAGVRFFGERLAADFALWTSPELIGEESFPFLPWVGFAYNFGR